uniref:Cytoplasmic phosphatidylinositol transfer protein 1-like n=1 Tax=Hirondellea gigas TaxID=1518452 RepID=A0A6A7G3W8_9CRUS
MNIEEYHIGQLYMIARHSAEQSDDGEGVETIVNEPCEDKDHGKGQYAEKRIHLTSKLPSWIRAYIPRFLYITEKSWNYYPYTVTEYTCSILPKFSIKIWTRYEDNNGSNNNVHAGTMPDEALSVEFVDISADPVRPNQYKEEEDPSKLQSGKTGRGPLKGDWRNNTKPIMCSYKLVDVSFAVFGLQTKVEEFVHKEIRNINVLAHRQAFAWLDEWHGWNTADVRAYEKRMQQETNERIRLAQLEKRGSKDSSSPVLDEEGNVKTSGSSTSLQKQRSSDSTDSSGKNSATTPEKQGGYLSGFFKWS